MRKTLLAALCASMTMLAIGVGSAQAQEAEIPTRIVAVTTFDVPFLDRAKVVDFLEEYFLPGYQLNPNVKNFRMLTHNWGSNASQVILVAEYDNFAAIEADCGEPCDSYFEQHETPEEGEAGYAEYQEKADAFSKYYAAHSDEIYSTNMNRAVVEGRMQGTVGPQPEEDM